jgi:hypothetical protein
MSLQRSLRASEFCKRVDDLKVYSDWVGTSLLEELERTRLVVPILRRRFPDPVIRRMWFESHNDHVSSMKGELEPDGERWEAACELMVGEQRWNSPIIFGVSEHPFDVLEERFRPFVFSPADEPFTRYTDLCTDVSNDVYPQLVDCEYTKAYYSSWQVLLAAEVADAHVRIRVNVADPATWPEASEMLRSGRLPSDRYSINYRPLHAIREFERHRRALDAVVYFAEECDRVLGPIAAESGVGRFRLSVEQSRTYESECSRLAALVSDRFGVDAEQLIALSHYLAERWMEWDRLGRPKVCGAYKAMLRRAIELLQRISGMFIEEIRDTIGHYMGSSVRTLDQIWPDWLGEEKQRVVRTLTNIRSASGGAVMSESQARSFVEFIASRGLEAFFWRLKSFEEHAFGGNSYALEGMKSDLQGFSLCVEHVATALGADDSQLYEKFKSLWRQSDVGEILRRGEVSPLARQANLWEDWPRLKSRIEALRGTATGAVAADLVLAHRIRGGVHYLLPEDDHFELESQFVALMRAAALTFLEVQSRESGPV